MLRWIATLAVLALPVSAQAQDAENGKDVFEKKCALCHAIGKKGEAGPDLKGVVGRAAGSTDFAHSEAMKKKGAEGYKWTEENLNKYLTNPAAEVPGNAMLFAGEPDEETRKDVIAFLAAQK